MKISLIGFMVVFICYPDSWDNVVDLDIKHRAMLPGLTIKDTGSIMTACFDLVFLFFPILDILKQA